MLDDIALRLLPVPFLAPDAGPGACHFVPECPSLPQRIRRYIRGEFGVGDTDKLVLLCTSRWQHGPYSNPDGERLALSIPRLVSTYLATLGRGVHLVHVGPFRYNDLCLDADHYHWMPPQPRFNKQFADLRDMCGVRLSRRLRRRPRNSLGDEGRAPDLAWLIAASDRRSICDVVAADLSVHAMAAGIQCLSGIYPAQQSLPVRRSDGRTAGRRRCP